MGDAIAATVNTPLAGMDAVSDWPVAIAMSGPVTVVFPVVA
jgi:hypothetical protein